jgi:hypothetical protein
MSIQNRNTLKGFFKKGQLPTESHFHDLIDSLNNKVDDGISKTSDDGLILSATGSSEKLISFYRSIEAKNPGWSIEINRGNENLSINNHIGDVIMSFSNDGNVGVNNNDPQHNLDINGTLSFSGRLGNKYSGKVLGDGKWHKILKELNGCHALEVVADIGKKKTGRYAMLHAFAMSTFGKSNHKIDIRQAYYGVRSNKIELRWTGTTYDFNLEIRTRNTYNGEYYIQYYISDLWLDTFMEN